MMGVFDDLAPQATPQDLGQKVAEATLPPPGPFDDLKPSISIRSLGTPEVSSPPAETSPFADLVPKGVGIFDDLAPKIPPQPEVAKNEPPVPGAPKAENVAFNRGLVSTLIGQNPTLAAEALEGLSHDAPDFVKGTLLSMSESARKLAALSPEDYKTRSKGFFAIDSVASVGEYLGETLGSGIGSMVPGMVTGGAGALVGSAIAPGVGTMVGGLAGAFTPAYLMSYGEVYKALKDAGVAGPDAGKYAHAAAGPMAALDLVSLKGLMAQFGIGTIKKEVAEAIARGVASKGVQGMSTRVATEGFKGARREGITEGVQDVMKIVDVSIVADKPFWTMDNLKSIAENVIGGAVVGGTLGGPAGISRPKPLDANTPATPEVIERMAKEMQGTPDPVTGAAASHQLPAPIFYSTLKRTVEEKISDNATPEQIRAILRNSPGVKAEEIQETRLEDFLQGAEGRVSKKNLLAYLEENQLQIEEVVKKPVNPIALAKQLAREAEEDWESIGVFTREDFIEEAESILASRTDGTKTQYDEYVAPGESSNYREVILKLPKQDPSILQVKNKLAIIVAATRLHGWGGGPDGFEIFENQGNQDFKDGHFKEANVVGHTRVTDRITATGQKTLHLEEIQNTHRQEGRKRGFIGGRSISIPKGISARQTRSGPGRFDNVWKVTLDNGKILEISTGRTEREAIEEANKHIKLKTRPPVPDVPFKTSWPDIVLKRMIRYAADNGYSRITLNSGAMQRKIYPGLNEEQIAGMEEFYDRILPSRMKYWAKKLGGTFGTSEIVLREQGLGSVEVARRQTAVVPHIDIPAHAGSFVQRGLPLFSVALPNERGVRFDSSAHALDPDTPAVEKMVLILDKIAKRMGIEKKIDVTINRSMYPYGELHPFNNGAYLIELGVHDTTAQIYGTLMHEFGHIVMKELFAHAPRRIKQAIKAAHLAFRQKMPGSTTMEWLIVERDNLASPRFGERNSSTLDTFSPELQEYWRGFDEWFAEQVAKWATTSDKPLNVVDKYFQSLGNQLKKMFTDIQRMLGLPVTPEKVMKQWLDSIMLEEVKMGEQVFAQLDLKTQETNQQLLDKTSPGVIAAPQQEETTAVRTGMDKLFGGKPPVEVQEMGAWGDKFNLIYKYGLTVVQVAKRNLHIPQLQRYVETMRQMHLEAHKIQNGAFTVSKAWRGLGDEAGRLALMLDDIQRLTFLPKGETQARHPTPEEFAVLVREHKLSNEGVRVFGMIRKQFDDFLTLNQRNEIREATRLTDPETRTRAFENIKAKFDAMRRKPYFPASRFGDHTIAIRNAKGNVMHFETVERSKFRTAAQVREELIKELEKDMQPGDVLTRGRLAKDAMPMLGMPPSMLKLMGEKLDLSEAQRMALEVLTFEMSPAQSFKHRFQRRRNVEGYSMDYQRAFAHYFFHGAKYYAKVKYVDQLRDLVKEIRNEAKYMPYGDKRAQIANFLDDHLKHELDPKPDWAALRGMVFLWALGFSPAAATVNLSQLPLGTFPFLAAKFGDRAAIAAMTRAGRQISTFYKRGKYENMPEFHFRAISEGINQGTIVEAMAPEIAGIAEGRTLGVGFGGTIPAQMWQKFQEYGAKMFELTEQGNRRITFRAALDLALRNPNNKHIDEVVEENKYQYDLLTAPLHQGGMAWSDAEARAFITAQDAVRSTQYEYARWARPRMFRGKLATLFVFKMFMQNTLFFLWNQPAAAVRYALIMWYLGGLYGMPGMEDLDDILKAVGWQFFGKDFDLEKEARRLVLDLAKGVIPPDILLHGMARRGYGIPTILDMLGNTVGRGDFDETLARLKQGRPSEGRTAAVPFPMLERSRAIGQGHILPVQVGKMLGPVRDPARIIADQTQNAAGVAFGTAFNIYKAMVDTQLGGEDFKRYEKAVPRQMGSLSRSYRAFSEGRERNRSGSTMVNYDVRDTGQMMEAIALGLGYNNIRQAAKWDMVIAEREAIGFWTMRKTGLMQQYFEAQKEPKSLDKVKQSIRKFNDDLPKETKDMRITPETLKRSMASRQRNRDAQETGVAVAKSTRGLQRSIQSLYPESAISVRKIQ